MFYKVETFYWIEFALVTFFFTMIYQTTQNIVFSALKPIPLSSTIGQTTE